MNRKMLLLAASFTAASLAGPAAMAQSQSTPSPANPAPRSGAAAMNPGQTGGATNGAASNGMTAKPADMAASATGGDITFISTPPTDAWRASKLNGADVYNAQEEKIGEVSDVLVTAEGRVSAVVLGVGGFLGIGTKYVAVPIDSVKMTREQDGDPRLQVNATRERLEKAPDFKLDRESRG